MNISIFCLHYVIYFLDHTHELAKGLSLGFATSLKVVDDEDDPVIKDYNEMAHPQNIFHSDKVLFMYFMYVPFSKIEFVNVSIESSSFFLTHSLLLVDFCYQNFVLLLFSYLFVYFFTGK